ncbi:HNH endonuclease signature motif containing protein [Pseudarthrobacter chlorophenolicus]|uniref:HNH endonuclease signature motif containing protein n=1 Tax=Pseudarthrobacter chlorophenolicus TaxID=85085 RepID=UPI0005F27B4B
MEAVRASVDGLDALFLKDAELGLVDDSAVVVGRDDAGAAAGSDVAGSGIDVLQRKSEFLLQRLALWKQLEAQIAAGKARDAADFAEFQEAMTPPEATGSERAFVEMSTTAEIAGVLTLSPGAAAAFISQSRKVCAMPLVLGALAAGSMSWRHAVIVADETDCLAPENAAALVSHFFDPDAPNRARGSAPGDLVAHLFRRKVRSWRERTHPASVQERHVQCVADRRMEYRPAADGMASITLVLPGDTACAIWNKTTAIARGLQGPGETRTLTQLRPDTVAALLLGAHTGAAAPGRAVDGQQAGDVAGVHGVPGGNDGDSGTRSDPYAVDLSKIPAPKADVLVTIPLFTLLGSTDEPADLDGYGPIPAAMARKLVADGATSFYRVLVDPRTGAPLEIGRTGYRLSEAMKRWIRMRDGHCTFPGCSNPSTDNDTDHLTAWQHHGTTGVSNLAQLCPKHHRLKHNSRWTPTPATTTKPPDWTSPTGRHYPSQHPDPQPPHWPPGLLELEQERALIGDVGAVDVSAEKGDLATGATGPAGRIVTTEEPWGQIRPGELPEEETFNGTDEVRWSLEAQILAGIAVCPEHLLTDPPDDEPLNSELFGDDLIEQCDLSPDDPLWEAFYATPFVLPADPWGGRTDWLLHA